MASHTVTFACLTHRTTARARSWHQINTAPKCPRCAQPMVWVHQAPKRADDRGWRAVRAQLADAVKWSPYARRQRSEALWPTPTQQGSDT